MCQAALENAAYELCTCERGFIASIWNMWILVRPKDMSIKLRIIRIYATVIAAARKKTNRLS